MSFRARLTLAAAAAVAVVLAAALAFVLVRSELRGQVDDALRTGAVRFEAPGPGERPFSPPGVLPAVPFGGARGFAQVVNADGEVLGGGRRAALPVGERTRAVAAGDGEAFYEDAEVDGVHLRVLTVQAAPGVALQVARPLDEVDRTLRRLALLLAALTLSGIGLAALLGHLVARAALAPVERMTASTEEITATGDLARRLEVGAGGDELGRLATRFNELLAALDGSLRAQRRLVADASHELRTPLTSLRTNIEVLARPGRLAKADREKLLADASAQLEEMSTLVADLVELARSGEAAAYPEDVRLDLLVGEAIERARRNAPGLSFAAALEPSTVRGLAGRIERAVANLLDNAAKWSPAGGEVEVVVRDGSVWVRDHGPGIDAEDRPFVFDRFYRAAAARSRPGSGLGLAIVRDVAEAHGGSVVLEDGETGGTRVRLDLLPSS